jgi:hypothetical protein
MLSTDPSKFFPSRRTRLFSRRSHPGPEFVDFCNSSSHFHHTPAPSSVFFLCGPCGTRRKHVSARSRNADRPEGEPHATPPHAASRLTSARPSVPFDMAPCNQRAGWIGLPSPSERWWLTPLWPVTTTTTTTTTITMCACDVGQDKSPPWANRWMPHLADMAQAACVE